MAPIPIGINPPCGGSAWTCFPGLVVPPFPICPALTPSSGSCLTSPVPYPDFGAIPGWLFSLVLAIVIWIGEVIIWLLTWLFYYLASGIVGLISLFVNGLLIVILTYWAAASALAGFSGPFAPITAVILVSVFTIATVYVVLFFAGITSNFIGARVKSAEGSSPSGSGGGSGGEAEEVAEVVA